MPTCRACAHPERDAIERALLSDESERRIAARFDLAPTSLRRHAAKHLPPRLLRAWEAEESSRAGDLLGEARGLLAREREAERDADRVRALAFQPGGDRRVALRAVETSGRSRMRQAQVLTLLGKLRGLLIESTAPDPLARPAPEPDPSSEARDDAIRRLSIDEQQQLYEAIHEAERLVAVGLARTSAPEPSPDE